MSDSPLILYHAWASSASRKVRFCLAEKGLSYEGRVLDLTRFQHHEPWYKKLNPSGIVPCLLVDDVALVESNQINEFLDEWRVEPSLMPADPFMRHSIRIFAKYVDDVCLPAVQKPNWMRTMRPVAMRFSDDELERRLNAIPTAERRALWRRMARDPFSADEMDSALAVLEDLSVRVANAVQSSGGPWMYGKQFTLADIAATPYIARLEEERPGHMPRVANEWWQAICARAGFVGAEIGTYVDDSERSVREAFDSR